MDLEDNVYLDIKLGRATVRVKLTKRQRAIIANGEKITGESVEDAPLDLMIEKPQAAKSDLITEPTDEYLESARRSTKPSSMPQGKPAIARDETELLDDDEGDEDYE